MTQQEFCHTCKQNSDCRKVYGQLGGLEGPSVAAKVVLAFLLPLVVFVVSLAAFDRILAGAIGEGHVLTAVSLLLALGASFTCILITGMINRQFGQGG